MDKYGEDDKSTLTSNISAVARYGVVEIYSGTENDITNKLTLDEDVKVVQSAKYAGSQYDGQSTTYTVALKFTEEAFDAILAAESSATETFYLKLTLGDTVLVNGQFSSEGITDRTIYVPNSTEAGALEIALQLSLGGLEYKFNQDIEAINVNPLLGKNSATLMAVTVGVIAILTIAGLIVLLKGFGVVSAISIVAFLFTFVAMLVAVPGIVLSVPGVLGMIVALIFTVVSMFATAKRVKEEYAKGKTIKSAIKAGYNGVFKSILNALVILVITSISILVFTTGTIQCFGITLGIGAGVSFLATALFSRLLTSCFVPLFSNPEGFFNLEREDA